MKKKITRNFIFLYYLIPILLITGPALPDISLSLISIFGVFIFYKNYKLIINDNILQKYSLFFLLFYTILIIGSFFSFNFKISFLNSIPFVRFYFFTIFIYLLILDDYKNVNKILYLTLSIVFLLISLDGIYEYFAKQNIFQTSSYNSHIENRISGLFGKEWIIGTYTIKLLPLYTYLFFSGIKKNYYFFFSIIFLSFVVIFLSGERAAFILSLLYLLILFLSLKIKPLYLFYILLTFILIFIIINLFDNSSFIRLIGILHPNEKYLKMYEVSLNIFLNSPFFGEGLYSFRYLCDYKEFSSYGYASCSTHPHNIYLQLLAEAGIFAFLIIFILFIICLFIIFKNIFFRKYDKVLLTFLCSSFVINLFPLLPSLNIFYNWHNVIIFFPVPFLLYELAKGKMVASGGLEPPRE